MIHEAETKSSNVLKICNFVLYFGLLSFCTLFFSYTPPMRCVMYAYMCSCMYICTQMCDLHVHPTRICVYIYTVYARKCVSAFM